METIPITCHQVGKYRWDIFPNIWSKITISSHQKDLIKLTHDCMNENSGSQKLISTTTFVSFRNCLPRAQHCDLCLSIHNRKPICWSILSQFYNEFGGWIQSMLIYGRVLQALHGVGNKALLRDGSGVTRVF